MFCASALRLTSRASFHTARVLRAEYPTGPSGRPLNAYFKFMKEIRDDIVKANPSLRATDVSKLIGQKWRDMEETVRVKYMNEYRDAMKIFKEK